MNITLKQLRYFSTLAREGHFGRAADRCSVSQPALSVQIREMERELGTALFERAPRSVRLTAFGETLLPRVDGILRAMNDLEELANTVQGRLFGRLRLGVIPTIAPYLLPGILAALARSHPETDVQVRETITSRLIYELSERRLDCALVALPVSEPGLEEVPLCTEPMMLVRPRSASGQPVPSLDALPKMRLLLLEEGHCFRDQALSFCNARPETQWEGLDGSSLSTLVQMVGAGLGVTLIPEIAIPVEIHSADVIVDRFPAPEPTRTLGLIWRKNTPQEDDLRVFATLVKDVIDKARSRDRC
nr:hydrogen peroxide-inducible genes activator [Marivita sp. GX14005]